MRLLAGSLSIAAQKRCVSHKDADWLVNNQLERMSDELFVVLGTVAGKIQLRASGGT
jgi:uracil-DNA glycosylase